MMTLQSSRRLWFLIPLLGVLAGLGWIVWGTQGTGSVEALQGAGEAREAAASVPGELAEVRRLEEVTERVQAGDVERGDAAEDVASEVASWRIHGRVRTPAGSGAARSLVALIAVRDREPVRNGERLVVKADEMGRFEMDVPGWARGVDVLLVARGKAWRPYSELVVLQASDADRPLELDLLQGVEISGHVVRDGLPLEGASLSVDVAYGVSGVHGAGREAWWADGRLEEKAEWTKSAADGSFAFTGLGPHVHRLEVDVPTSGAINVSVQRFQIQAPSRRVYDMSWATLAVAVHAQYVPVLDARIWIECDGRRAEGRSMAEPVLARVPPSKKVVVTVDHDGAESVILEVQSPGAGQTLDVVVPLEIVQRPSMTVLLPGAAEAGVNRIRLRLQASRGQTNVELEAQREAESDRFRVQVVPLNSGKYSLILEPHRSDGMGGFVAPQKQGIDLPRTGDLFVEFELGFTGRYSVHINAPGKKAWSATYRVLDEAGERMLEREISASRISFDDGESFDGVQEFMMMTSAGWGGLGVESVREVAARCGVLEAGSYRLVVESEGHETWRGSFDVEAGKTERVSVLLKAKE